MKNLSNTTAILISFMRPEYTMECIKSLKEIYPSINILVGENGKYNTDLGKFCQENKTKYILMPFDSGVCFARNRLVEFVNTEYILIGDDDFYYNKKVGIDKMVKFLKEHEEFDLIGGRIYEHGKVSNYQGNIKIFDDHFEYIKLDDKYEKCQVSGLRYKKCDITFNFFVVKKQPIKYLKWDEKIKVSFEHSDWFLSLKKAGINIAFTPDCIVVHKPDHIELDKEIMDLYKYYRNRRIDGDYFFRKHKIKYSIGFRGIKKSVEEMLRK